MTGVAPQVHPSIRRLADRLGVSPDEVLVSVKHSPERSPGCPSLTDLISYGQSEQVPNPLKAHVKACEACRILWQSILPKGIA
jgi:hypothetical protein